MSTTGINFPVQQFTNQFGDIVFTLDQQGNLSVAGSVTGETPGQKFWVDSVNGAANNDGLSPSTALDTINAAVALCTPDTGNVIFVMPGSYDENVVVDVNGVSLIGVVAGSYEKPDITPAVGVALVVTGQGFVCQHCRFASLLVDCVQQEGNGFLYSDCVFDGDLTAAKAGLRLVPNDTDDSLTASEGFVVSSLFRGCAIGICFDTAPAPVGVGSTDNQIAANRFYANTLDIATADTGTGLYSVKTTLIGPGNQFMDKNKATYIDLTTANGGAASDQTGAINNNTFASDTITTTKIKMVGTGFVFAGNYYTVGIADGSGLD